jgi:hypothetical protein
METFHASHSARLSHRPCRVLDFTPRNAALVDGARPGRVFGNGRRCCHRLRRHVRPAHVIDLSVRLEEIISRGTRGGELVAVRQSSGHWMGPNVPAARGSGIRAAPPCCRFQPRYHCAFSCGPRAGCIGVVRALPFVEHSSSLPEPDFATRWPQKCETPRLRAAVSWIERRSG